MCICWTTATTFPYASAITVEDSICIQNDSSINQLCHPEKLPHNDCSKNIQGEHLHEFFSCNRCLHVWSTPHSPYLLHNTHLTLLPDQVAESPSPWYSICHSGYLLIQLVRLFLTSFTESECWTLCSKAFQRTFTWSTQPSLHTHVDPLPVSAHVVSTGSVFSRRFRVLMTSTEN
jgi:hypothetical protein